MPVRWEPRVPINHGWEYRCGGDTHLLGPPGGLPLKQWRGFVGSTTSSTASSDWDISIGHREFERVDRLLEVGPADIRELMLDFVLALRGFPAARDPSIPFQLLYDSWDRMIEELDLENGKYVVTPGYAVLTASPRQLLVSLLVNHPIILEKLTIESRHRKASETTVCPSYRPKTIQTEPRGR
jgi:hypothetical protein